MFRCPTRSSWRGDFIFRELDFQSKVINRLNSYLSTLSERKRSANAVQEQIDNGVFGVIDFLVCIPNFKRVVNRPNYGGEE